MLQCTPIHNYFIFTGSYKTSVIMGHDPCVLFLVVLSGIMRMLTVIHKGRYLILETDKVCELHFDSLSELVSS